MRRRNALGQGQRQGQRRGPGLRGGPRAAGPGGRCICPECGHSIEHVIGQPCNQQKCPKCGTPLIRE